MLQRIIFVASLATSLALKRWESYSGQEWLREFYVQIGRNPVVSSAPYLTSLNELPASRAGGSSTRIILLMEALICAASIILLVSFAYRSGNPQWSLAAAALFGWMAILSFRMSPRATVLLLPNLIGSASTIVALVMIEYGAKIPELGMMGYANGSTATYTLYSTICFWFFLVCFNSFVGNDVRPDQPLSLFFDKYATVASVAILAVAFLATAYLILGGLRNGFPLLSGIDRYVYRRYSADKIMLYVLNLKAMISITLGMASFVLPVSRLLKLASISLFALLSLVFFLFGEKFFTQLISFATFLTPYLYQHHHRLTKMLPKLLALGGIALTLVFSVTWFIYSDGGRENPAATMQRLSGRMVGQGELWFLQNQIGSDLVRWDEEFVDKNIRALRVKEMNMFALREGIGASYFSNRYAPDNIRGSMLRNAGTVTYTAALEPLGLAAFGWLGLVAVMLFTGAVIALSAAYLVRAIRLRSVISCIFAMFIIAAVRSYTSQGAPWQIIGIYALKWFAVIFVIELGLTILNRIMRPQIQMRRSLRLR